LVDLVGRRQHEPKAQINKIYTGDSDDDITGDHDTTTDDTIDEIHERDLGVVRPSLWGLAHVTASVAVASASPVKL
jgi:hypothetical protein